MTQALVLGATGHIGANIVRALLADGVSVRAAYRNPQYLSVLEGLSVERVRVDLETGEGLNDALRGCGWVFQAAGYYPRFRGEREAAIAKGVATTQRFFDAARASGAARVVFTSSAATIKRIPGQASTETDAERWPLETPLSVYSAVKIAMEQEALRAAASGLGVVITNPSICIGEYDAHRFSGLAVLLFAKHKLPWYIDLTLNVVYTADVGTGHVRAAQRGRIGERYILAGENISLKDFAHLVAKSAGVRPPFLRVPRSLAWLIACGSEVLAWVTRGQPMLPRQAVSRTRGSQILDASKAVRELGLPRAGTAVAVERSVAWFKKYGYL